MTAEVAVLNAHGVALAADSAVTTGDDKVFNTVNKLFALSRKFPIGIMVYNSAMVLSIPVETVIKEYRKERGDTPRDHVNDYAEDFKQFLLSKSATITDECQVFSVGSIVIGFARWVYDETYRRIAQARDENGWGWGRPTKSEARQLCMASVAEAEKRTAKAGDLPGVNLSLTAHRIRRRAKKQVDLAGGWIGGEFGLTVAERKLLVDAAIRHVQSNVQFQGHTGFVIAGFGEQQMFPSLRSFQFHCAGIIDKIIDGGRTDYEPGDGARIMAFAQHDVISTFINGSHPNVSPFVKTYVRSFLDQRADELDAATPPDPAGAIAVRQAASDFVGKWDSRFRQMYMDDFALPLLTVVDAMPKEEIALLAEALINLTGLKRHASRDAETVGGPTDVAVISKGDGFVWIKRKHYFEGDVNLDYKLRHSLQT